MAMPSRRLYYKYGKCLVLIAILAFFIQLFLAVYFFPPENELLNLKRFKEAQEIGHVSARKIGLEDDEDFSVKNKNTKGNLILRLDELDFKPLCEIKSREAISSIHRAKTQSCKQQIVNKTCLIQTGKFYPKVLPNSCLSKVMYYGTHLGCFKDEKKLRLLSSFYGNYVNTNSRNFCLDVCVQGGFPFAGVQYGTECFCGDKKPQPSSKVASHQCDMKCPGDVDQNCGGYFTMDIYETGLEKMNPVIPMSSEKQDRSVRIVFLLTLNGRALRQVYRLINVLYRSTHYFYIHIDARQDYLHRKLSELEKQFPNIKLAKRRYSTIWGGASLLQMLLASMTDFIELGWEWDYVINLSESDFLIKSLESLESFLSSNKGLNFVKSHGREVQRFIKKQGLDKTFVECDTHMWRLGNRTLPRGIIIDGGSDWIALSPDFVQYVIGKGDDLLAGLDVIFEHTLLPAESYFHTVLRNSPFCTTYVDNNLHVTNWKRKFGCKCQYKHVVDWCGCSPNNFRTEDWPRIQNTKDRQLFFARKFEPIINQAIITRVEQFIGYNDHYLIDNIEAYWQSLYNSDDLPASSDDVLLSHSATMVRHNAKILQGKSCKLEPTEILEITSYNYADTFKGNLILHKALINDDEEVLIETWYKPQKQLDLNFEHKYVENVKIFTVSSDYDQKETTFRNFANILGPLSEPVLLYQFSPFLDNPSENFTVVWLDPAGVIAEINIIHINENNLTNFIKPNLKNPILPGIWKVGLFEHSNIISSTTFLITPVEYFSGKQISQQEASILHSGSQNSYKNYSFIEVANFLPSHDDSALLKKLMLSNVRRLQKDLRDWIDSLSLGFYKVLGSCVNSLNIEKTVCGKHKFEQCSSIEWSSLSSDIKGRIGKLNKQTGLLDRL